MSKKYGIFYEEEWEDSFKKVRMHSEQSVDFEEDWWNAPYKVESEG